MRNRISVDPYTKIVLTVIALCLVWLCLTDARAVAPLAAQAQEAVDVRITAIGRGTSAPWDPVSIRADVPLAAEILNEQSIPVVVTNELVPVDLRQTSIQGTMPPFYKK